MKLPRNSTIYIQKQLEPIWNLL